MGKRKTRPYQVCAFYDTETTTFLTPDKHRHAITILYQFNDVRECELSQYRYGENDCFRLFRVEEETLNYIDSLIEWGNTTNVIPVIGVYNLRYDIQSIFDSLHKKYSMTVSAQNSMNIYTLDLWLDNKKVLRFWDMFYLNTRGLAEMGRICGCPKLHTWDYDKKRSVTTPLTESEIEYACRDVQIPAQYCAWLLTTNPWLDSSMLGNKIITSTSVVRQYGFHKFGKIKSSQKSTIGRDFKIRAQQNLAKTFDSYATQRACLRGGLAFTSAAYANVIQYNVCSLDTTSMHIQFLPCRMPVFFAPCGAATLQRFAEKILKVTRENILSHYTCPFPYAFNACVEFTNLRLKENSIFEKAGIATLARQKCVRNATFYPEIVRNDSAELQENTLRNGGYHDIVVAPQFALGKLYAAEKCQLWLTEIELWIMSRVYSWDSMKVIRGEVSLNYRNAPEMLTLTAMDFYTQKNDLKIILKTYDGTPYTGDIPSSIPDNVAENLRQGNWSVAELHNYYTFVKQCLNSIYGTQVQDIYKPSFVVTLQTEITLDESTVCDESNFDDKQPRQNKVIYNYGIRIVGRSRLHLVLAMELLNEKWGETISILGGDTDSLKIAINDFAIQPQELVDSLKILHDASDTILKIGGATLQSRYPRMYHEMNGIGHFVAEKCGDYPTYYAHVEFWNKCRVSFDFDGKPHVTCAGLVQSDTTDDINDVYFNMSKKHGMEWALIHGIGYNTIITADVAHNMGRTTPKSVATLQCELIDYLGEITTVNQHEAIGLYEIGKTLGDLTGGENLETIMYLNSKYNRHIDFRMKWIGLHEQGYLGTTAEVY